MSMAGADIRAFHLPTIVVTPLRQALPEVAEHTVVAITAEVPAYAEAFAGELGAKIEMAVQAALRTFLNLVSRPAATGPGSPLAPAVDAAYALGRGEARSGRSLDALLAAYRVGARVAWRELASIAVGTGRDALTITRFAEVVFAYIDQLSAASVAGHADELATTGRVRRRYLDRLAQTLLADEPPEVVIAAAERADWPPPQTLTAVLLPERAARAVVDLLDARTLQITEDHPPRLADGHPDRPAAPLADDETSVLLVPDAHGPSRAHLARLLAGRGAVVGPARPWLQARDSLHRALRTARLTASQTTGARAAGSQAGSRTAGSQTTGSQTTGSQAVGSQVAGSQAVGSQVAGSQAVGSQAVGSQAASRVAGSRVAEGAAVDTEDHLVALVVTADPDALADLRAQALAPLAEERESTAAKLTETLRSWLLHHGRREEVAAELFVHPQTVRYRMARLRELYGDRLRDPQWLLLLTIALAADVDAPTLRRRRRLHAVSVDDFPSGELREVLVDDYPFGELAVHRIGFGTAALTAPTGAGSGNGGSDDTGSALDRTAAVAVLRQAVAWGVDHIDIAPRHAPGVVHAVIREALHPYPEDLALVVTVGAVRPSAGVAWLRDGVLAHLRGLGAERLAAVNLRLPDPAVDGAADAGFDEQLDALAAVRDEGLIAGIGLSHASVEQLSYAMQRVEITCVRNPFSVVDRASEAVLWACARQGIAFVPCHPLGLPTDGPNAVLSHPAVSSIAERRKVTAAQVVLAWQLEFAPNLLPAPGALSLPQLREHLDAATLPLDRADLAALDAG